MRILVIHNYYQEPGGEDTVFRQEVEQLSQTEEVFTLTFRNEKGWKGLRQFIASPWNIAAANRVEQYIREVRPDVVHLHNTHYAASPLIIRRIKRLGKPLCMTVHNFRMLCPSAILYYKDQLFLASISATFPWKAVRLGVWAGSRLKTFWLAFSYFLHRQIGTWSLVDRYLFLTDFAKDIFIHSTFPLQKNQILVKGNAVQRLARVCAEPADYFIFIGRLSVEKGIIPFLEAFKDAPYHLKIVGAGPLQQEVEQYAHIYPRIEYLGFRTAAETAELLAQASALVVPSIWYEGMPMTILEALSVGTPILANDIGVLAEMVQPEQTGLLFDMADPNTVVRQLTHWHTLPAYEKMRIRKNCINLYETSYTPEINKKHLLNIYKQLI